jgi:hypothetical protein
MDRQHCLLAIVLLDGQYMFSIQREEYGMPFLAESGDPHFPFIFYFAAGVCMHGCWRKMK